MKLHSVTLSSVAPTSWQNGGGRTRELLTWPPADDEEAPPWQLRVSVAEVDRAGPFSALPGIERWFAVVSGGLTLEWPGQRRCIAANSAPLRFDGALPPQCAPLDSLNIDLNLMVRQSCGSGGMQTVKPGQEWRSDSPWRALYAAEAMRLLIGGALAAEAGAGTLLWSEWAAGEPWCALGSKGAAPEALRGWWLEFAPHPTPMDRLI